MSSSFDLTKFSDAKLAFDANDTDETIDAKAGEVKRWRVAEHAWVVREQEEECKCKHECIEHEWEAKEKADHEAREAEERRKEEEKKEEERKEREEAETEKTEKEASGTEVRKGKVSRL